jgi:ribosomal protein L11 methyltransferase
VGAEGSTAGLAEAKIEIDLRDVEKANDVLLDLGNERWTLLEDAIAMKAWILGIFGSETEARASWSDLWPRLGSASVIGELRTRELGASEWRDSYKKHFHAWQFGRLHWVPIWERQTYAVPVNDAVLWLDPGLAFGTGNHETTRLCVERLVERVALNQPIGTVIDAGCGSGILALSAAKLGFPCPLGFDNDPEAIRVSVENAAMNDLESSVHFHVGDLMTGFAAKQWDVVLANILANVLIESAEQLVRAVAPGGWLILSGILSAECHTVKHAFQKAAPKWPQQSRVMGEWSDLLLIRPSER